MRQLQSIIKGPIMKKTLITCLTLLTLHMHAYRDSHSHYHYMNPPEHHIHHVKHEEKPPQYRYRRKTAHSSLFVLASLYGALSGYLCRAFEREVLQDIPPFRLINLLIWGHLQGNLLETMIEDLKEQNVGMSDSSMKRSAWLLSWLTYFMS